MKHRFLLDLNIIYHAIRGVDEHDQPDPTCAQLLLLIGQNCHTIVVTKYLYGEYLSRVSSLFTIPAPALPPIYFLNQLLLKAEKFHQDTGDLPTLPNGVDIPAEDIDLVRSAMLSTPTIIAADEELREAIRNCPQLGLKAVHPREALMLAEDS